ncbi:hypothetical protein [Actinomycetospora soli]|uniref:hypothetical protein n=1 Tax=Actinomycetospora soli TaxID=2893887 RepID=UPI001E5690A5|nr:hypothetical protein [Actinomycetospora soli]MCD2190966.1 hypothetical protein [Actinomycetospora soli]
MGAGDAGDQAGIPRHPAHQPPQHRQSDSATVFAPQLGVDELFEAGQGEGLVAQHHDALGEAVAPAGVHREPAGVDAAGRAAAAVGE